MFLGSDWIVGVVGALQFEILADRIRTEYGVPVRFEPSSLHTARWVEAEQPADDGDSDLPWKTRKRLEKSRRPHEARAQMSPEERATARLEERKRRGAERRKGRAAAKAKHPSSGTGTRPAEKDANAAKIEAALKA